jgi:hypothetical protein
VVIDCKSASLDIGFGFHCFFSLLNLPAHLLKREISPKTATPAKNIFIPSAIGCNQESGSVEFLLTLEVGLVRKIPP